MAAAEAAFKPKIVEKRWDVRREEELLKLWEAEGIYKFNRDSGKPIFSIDTPPPYASGKWHVGGATHYAQIDMVARYYRMKGREVLFPFGIDRNGLPVEVEVEKAYGVSGHRMPREEFLKLCREHLDRVEAEIIAIARRLGLSCDFENVYRTDSPEYRALTQATFLRLWREGLVYEAERPTNWCPSCGTSIADAEIEYKEVETDLCYIKFGLEGGGEVVIATTRPELLCTCAAVIYNPADERYQWLEGMRAIVPIFGQSVPIMPNPAAKPEFGTGLVMLCSFGDYTDIRLFHELGLKAKIAINERGEMNELAGPYAGMKVEEARAKIIEDLEKAGLLIKRERIRHKIPVCWRSKDPIEFVAMREYYLKQLDFLDELREVAGQMEFHPPESRQLLINWINSLTADWPISRRRFYGTEIPLWKCRRCGHIYAPEPGKYYQPWKEPCPAGRCEKCGSSDFEGETRTFDTWMDSSISQLYIIGYGRDEELFKKAFPCTLRPQGYDIVRTWLYYSTLRTYQLLKSKPFEKVRISGMGLDERGEAMHKSKGNIIWTEPILEEFGADAFRLWGALEARLGSDYRFSRERLAGAARFITKLWNIARFISCFPADAADYELAPADKMLLSRLNGLIIECERGYEEMDFFIPAHAIRSFVWDFFADHYVELVKARAYNASGRFEPRLQRGAWHTLHEALKAILKLLAPICPFVTDAIWRELYSSRSVHVEEFPKPRADWEFPEYAKLAEALMEFDSSVWKFKKMRNMRLVEPIALAYAPEELRPLADDLAAMHRISELRFGEPSEFERSSLTAVGCAYLRA